MICPHCRQTIAESRVQTLMNHINEVREFNQRVQEESRRAGAEEPKRWTGEGYDE